MITLASAVSYLMTLSGMALVVLVALVVYGNVLDNNEDEELYLNPTEQSMMASNQPALIRRMKNVASAITVVSVITGLSFVASAGIWIYLSLFKS